MNKIFISSALGKNFLQYKLLELDFSQPGLVFLSGSLAHDRMRSNSAGKTTALSLVPWALWGKTLKDTRDASSVITYGELECTARVEGLINGESFYIHRTRTSSRVFIEASFAGSSRAKDVQDEINEVFGTFDMAQNTVFLAQRKALEFLSSTDADRRRILEDLLKLGVWRAAYDRVVEDLAWAKSKESDLIREISEATHNKKMIEADIKHFKELALSDIRSQIDTYNDLLEKKSQEVLEAKKNLTFMESDQTHLDNVEAFKKLNSKAKFLDEQVIIKKTYIRSCNEKNKSLLSLSSSVLKGLCPTCGQEVSKENSALESIKRDIQYNTTLIEENESSIKKDYESKKILLESMQTLGAKISEFSASIEDLKNSLRFASLEKEKHLRKIEELKSSLRSAESALLVDRTEELRNLGHIIHSRTCALQDLQYGKKVMDFWKEGFSIKGVPSMLIKESLPLLVKKTNEALSILSSGDLVFDILPADSRRDNKALIDKITFVVNKGGRDVYMEDCSSGEQRRIVISIFLALASMQTVLTGQSWNILMIDELFDELDEHGIHRVVRLLKEISKSKSVLVTSHRSEMAGIEGFDRFLIALRSHDNTVLKYSTSS